RAQRRRRVNWQSKRTVLLALGAVWLVVFIGGMAAAWNNRHHTICSDHKPPVSQRGGVLGQIEYRCHDGSTVTTPG
ncbi:MAG TPA: hypothetical protein VF327_12190, partial [Gaiellaceae bacterium]